MEDRQEGDDDHKTELIKSHIEEHFGSTQAADAFISIFSSAAKSYQADSLLTPYPKLWFNEDGSKNFQKVIATVDKFPSVEDFLTLLMTGNDSIIPNASIDLVSHLLIHSKFSIKTVPLSRHADIFGLIESVGKLSSKPNYIFKIDYNDSKVELRFKEHAKIMGTKFAYHGTKFSRIYSILNHGLQQHLNKNSLYGEGIYCSTELDISLHFSPAALNWSNSKLGGTISCIAICEYVNDPNYVKIRKENAKNSDIPHSYILITNNEVVRVRYLLIYGKKRANISKKATKAANEPENLLDIESDGQTRFVRYIKWCRKNPFIVSVLLYILLLLLIGISNNRLIEYYRNHLVNFFKNRFKFL